VALFHADVILRRSLRNSRGEIGVRVVVPGSADQFRLLIRGTGTALRRRASKPVRSATTQALPEEKQDVE